MVSEPFVKMLKKLDRVLMSNDPTVIDALKQAMVLTEVSDHHDPFYIYPVGPLESMYSRIENLSNKLDMMMVNRYQTGTYTSNNTGSYWSEPGYGAVGSTGYGAIDAAGSYNHVGKINVQDYNYMMQEFSAITAPNDREVVPASPTEEGAFVLFDPDTGDSLSVKYK